MKEGEFAGRSVGASSHCFLSLDKLLEGFETDHLGGDNGFDKLAELVRVSKPAGDMCSGVNGGPSADDDGE